MIGATRCSSSCSSTYQLARPSHHGVEANTPSRLETGEALEARPFEAGCPGEEAAVDGVDQRRQELRRNVLEAEQAEAGGAVLPPRGQRARTTASGAPSTPRDRRSAQRRHRCRCLGRRGSSAPALATVAHSRMLIRRHRPRRGRGRHRPAARGRPCCAAAAAAEIAARVRVVGTEPRIGLVEVGGKEQVAALAGRAERRGADLAEASTAGTLKMRRPDRDLARQRTWHVVEGRRAARIAPENLQAAAPSMIESRANRPNSSVERIKRLLRSHP